VAQASNVKTKKTMTTLVKEYLAHRRALGYALQVDGRLLLNFGRYADRARHRGSLTADLAVRWARLPRQAQRLYWAKRLRLVNRFAKYLAIFDPKTEIPPADRFGSANLRPSPFIYSSDQILQLMQAATKLRPAKSLRSQTYATLIGLLACSGLRISEALRLSVEDVDLVNGVITVRESKYHRSRFVPLHRTAIAPLRGYARARAVQFPRARSFFVSQQGMPLILNTVEGGFRYLAKKSGLNQGSRRPRLQDLRHSFASMVLLKWYRQTQSAEDRIAILADYLGHGRVTDTYWYLSAVPELLQRTAAKFEHFLKRTSP
jgi:integrase